VRDCRSVWHYRHIASVAGFFGFPSDTAYSVAKGGTLQPPCENPLATTGDYRRGLPLTKALAIDYTPHNIRVNAISPGWTATPVNAGLRSDPETLRVQVRGPLIKRPAEPEEIAAAAVYFASDEAAYVTGANLVIDGGWSLRSALGRE